MLALVGPVREARVVPVEELPLKEVVVRELGLVALEPEVGVTPAVVAAAVTVAAAELVAPTRTWVAVAPGEVSGRKQHLVMLVMVRRLRRSDPLAWFRSPITSIRPSLSRNHPMRRYLTDQRQSKRQHLLRCQLTSPLRHQQSAPLLGPP